MAALRTNLRSGASHLDGFEDLCRTIAMFVEEEYPVPQQVDLPAALGISSKRCPQKVSLPAALTPYTSQDTPAGAGNEGPFESTSGSEPDTKDAADSRGYWASPPKGKHLSFHSSVGPNFLTAPVAPGLVSNTAVAASPQTQSPRRLSKVSTAAGDEDDEEDADESGMMPSDGTIYRNPGSLGHPEFCSRQCIYFASGACSNGEACTFCHMPHRKRPARLDRMCRDLLRNMSFVQRAGIILPTVKQKMQALGLSTDAVFTLESHIAADLGDESRTIQHMPLEVGPVQVGQKAPPLKAQTERKIRSALKWHSTRVLIKLLGYDMDMSPAARQVLDGLEEQLRQY